MSKFFWKITIGIFAGLFLLCAVLSCKKSATPSSLTSLNGTEWMCILSESDGYIALSFLSERDALFVEEHSQEKKEYRCTYSYSNPDVTITFTETSNSISGTVLPDGYSLEITDSFTMGRVK